METTKKKRKKSQMMSDMILHLIPIFYVPSEPYNEFKYSTLKLFTKSSKPQGPDTSLNATQ